VLRVARGRPSAPAGVDRRRARTEATRLERSFGRLLAQEADLAAQIEAAAADYQQVLDLDARLRALQAERVQLEDQWLAAAEIAES
jgi:ATP-binding cassette subfamily F protein uup